MISANPEEQTKLCPEKEKVQSPKRRKPLEHVLNDLHGIGQMRRHDESKGEIVETGQGFR